MSIQVICPNGHRLKVKDHWAGRTGRCPKCGASIKVPDARANISDDEVLAIIGEQDSPPPKPAIVADESSDDESDADANVLEDYDAQLTSGLSLLGSGVIPNKRVCRKCGREASHWSASCGHCGTYFDAANQ